MIRMKKTNKSKKTITHRPLKKKQREKDLSSKRTTAKTISSTDKKAAKEKNLFPVVAIGASAGGIEAISNLLETLSPRLGMAYVIIQHLSPDHESILPELLERKTEMPVHQVEGGMPVQPDNIYVIPPNTYMSIKDGMLKLSPRIKSNGNYHSIDFFL